MSGNVLGVPDQSEKPVKLEDPILETVRLYNIQYKNTEFSKQPPIKIGKGRFYTVTFKGEDRGVYANFVYAEDGKKEDVYQDLRSLITDKGGGILPVWDIEWLRPIGLFIVVILLLFASAIAGYFYSDGKVFTAFMGAFSAALGYLFGREMKT